MKILGITDEYTTCECCGKAGLKCTVAIEYEAGGTVYFGRDCAARKIYGSNSASNVRKIEATASMEQRNAKRLREEKLARVANDRSQANYRYMQTRRELTGSYFAYRNSEVVRVDGSDKIDVSFYASEGFVTNPASVV